MAVYVSDSAIDGGIDYVIANGDKVYAIESYSTDYSAVVADAFAEYTAVITKGDRAAGGREATLAAVTGLTTSNITTTKVFTHYAVVDTVNTNVVMIGEADGKTYNNADTMAVSEYPVYQLTDPASA